MRRQQLIQLLQFVLVRIWLGLFVVYVMEQSFIDFIIKYRLYLLIVSISYFYYYRIEYDPDDKYEIIRNVLIYGNIYLFLHIFFRPLLNISHQLFVLLGLIILGIRWSTKLKSRRKYLLQIIGGIFSFFIMISGMFYFYPESPDIEGFLKSKYNEIRIFGANSQVEKMDAYIKITSGKGSEDVIIIPGLWRMISENTKISYPSLKSQREENLIVETPQGDLVWIFPQSEVQLEFEGGNLKKISKLDGKIGFLSGVFESNIEIFGNTDLTQDQQIWIESVQKGYKLEVISYLKKQISKSNIGWANNTIMYNIDGKIIKYLAKMFPVSFGKNLHNYNEFQKYFDWDKKSIDLGRYSMKQGTGWSMKEFWGNIRGNVNLSNDDIKHWFKKPQPEQ